MSDATFIPELVSEGTGTAAATITVLRSGSQTVDSGQSILGEDNSPIQNEDGGKVSEETVQAFTSSNVVLDEDGGGALLEDGGKLSDESATLTATPIQGAATPLMRVSTIATRVTILAKSANTAAIWTGDENIVEGIGIPLLTTSDRYDLLNKDLSKIYIVGIVGEGVTFNYEIEEEAAVDSGAILGEDGDAILGEDGGKVLGEDAADSTDIPSKARLDSDGNPVLDSDGNYILDGD